LSTKYLFLHVASGELTLDDIELGLYKFLLSLKKEMSDLVSLFTSVVYIYSEIDKMSKGQRSDQDFLLYDGHLIEDWVTKFYLNKEQYNGSYN
jgi:hypothetical protein